MCDRGFLTMIITEWIIVMHEKKQSKPNGNVNYAMFCDVMCTCTQSAVVTQNNGWIITAEHSGKFPAPKFGL